MDTKTMEEELLEKLKKLARLKLTKYLSLREQKIISMRFGIPIGKFIYKKTHTLEEVGQEFGVTRERIRQLEAKILGKIIHRKEYQKLNK